MAKQSAPFKRSRSIGQRSGRVRLFCLGLLLCGTLLSCQSEASGPRHTVCGTQIGQPAQAGPSWYYDETSRGGSSTVRLSPPGPQAGAWVQFTDSCTVGVRLRIADGSIVAMREKVLARDGRYVAAFLVPLNPGSTEISILSTSTSSARTVQVKVDASAAASH